MVKESINGAQIRQNDVKVKQTQATELTLLKTVNNKNVSPNDDKTNNYDFKYLLVSCTFNSQIQYNNQQLDMSNQQNQSILTCMIFSPELYYVIKFQSSQQQYEQKGWYIAINKYKQQQFQRSLNTRWLFLQKLDGNILQVNIKWRFIHQQQNVYKIVVAQGQYINYQLFSYQDVKQDKRDAVSFLVFAAPQTHKTMYNRWELIYIGDNNFIIRNTDSKRYLSSHRYYNLDKRKKDSTWLMTHEAQSVLGVCKINIF